MTMSYVYLITVHPSEKRYVGQTKDMDDRFYRHLYTSRGPVHNELQNLEPDAYIEMIELWRGPTEDADLMERAFIREYGCIGPKGLNKATGGLEGFEMPEGFRDYVSETTKAGWEDPVIRDRRMTGILRAWDNDDRREHISALNKEKNKDPAYRAMVRKAHIMNTSTPVEMYDLETGDTIATFASMSMAIEILNLNQQDLCRCCNGQLRSHRGFGWRFSDENVSESLVDHMYDKEFREQVVDRLRMREHEVAKDRLVAMCDPEDGHLIKIFNTIMDAERYVGGTHQHIRKCMTNMKNHITHKGYKWRKVTDEEAEIFLQGRDSYEQV